MPVYKEIILLLKQKHVNDIHLFEKYQRTCLKKNNNKFEKFTH